MYSALILAPSAGDNGMFYGRDFMDINLRAELVVLLACERGLGKQTGGELTWVLFVAGAPGSIVSQWSHRDDSSAKLMLAFYEMLNSPGTIGAPPGKAKALQQAQLSLLRTDGYSLPTTAAFVLVDDWH
jgi:CHAT domain-containing protein